MVQEFQILCVTTDSVPGRTIEKALGPVLGSACFEHYESGCMSVIPFISKRPKEASIVVARQSAINAMCKAAKERGAHAIVGMQFDSVVAGVSKGDVKSWHPFRVEYTAYGTAVMLE